MTQAAHSYGYGGTIDVSFVDPVSPPFSFIHLDFFLSGDNQEKTFDVDGSSHRLSLPPGVFPLLNFLIASNIPVWRATIKRAFLSKPSHFLTSPPSYPRISNLLERSVQVTVIGILCGAAASLSITPSPSAPRRPEPPIRAGRRGCLRENCEVRSGNVEPIAKAFVFCGDFFRNHLQATNYVV